MLMIYTCAKYHCCRKNDYWETYLNENKRVMMALLQTLTWVSYHLENLNLEMIKANILTKIHDGYINK